MLSGHKWLAARLVRVALPGWGMQVRVGRFVSCALVGLALSLLVSPAGADELRQLYAQILRDPTNSELNFRYAQLAEQRGEIRKALSAYERILLNDPDNPDVRRALQRVRRALQPDTTQFFAELGAAYESNPRRLATGGSDDGVARARLVMRDERGVGGGMRWRTVGQLAGDLYFDNSDLRYGYAGGYTGPLIDIAPTIAMHAALGGGASYFDNRLFYKEATANLTFESYLEGALHTVRVRSGYRSYNDGFPSDDGFYADITGRFSFPNIFNSGTLMVVSPWYRWSDIGGTGFSLLTPSETVQPGKYNEVGGRVEFYRRVFDWLTVGAGVAVSHRGYAQSFDTFAFTSTKRRDLMVTPSATMIFHNVAGYQTDLRADYRFEHNDSNVAVRDYENHIATLMLVSRF
jgi:hypothetical protein